MCTVRGNSSAFIQRYTASTRRQSLRTCFMADASSRVPRTCRGKEARTAGTEAGRLPERAETSSGRTLPRLCCRPLLKRPGTAWPVAAF